MIIKSFGQEITRPAVIMFENNIPVKGHCTCPIGKCGICCHTVALFMFLEQYSKSKTRLLSLTCTEKMQKWHRKGAIKAGVPTKTSHIVLRSFRNTRSMGKPLNNKGRKRKTRKKSTELTGDVDRNDNYKRDVDRIASQTVTGIDKQQFHIHFYKTLSRYNIKTSGLAKQLHYNNSWKAKVVFMYHDYCRNTDNLYDHKILNTESPVKSAITVPTSSVETEATLEHEQESQQQHDGDKIQSEAEKLMYQNEDTKILHLLELLHAAKEM